jgi:hypothetical protein
MTTHQTYSEVRRLFAASCPRFSVLVEHTVDSKLAASGDPHSLHLCPDLHACKSPLVYLVRGVEV